MLLRGHVLTLSVYFFSMDSVLADFEHRHGIKVRWSQNDQSYLEAKKMFLREKKEQLQTSLWACVIKRHYLLKLKAKYAGM